MRMLIQRVSEASVRVEGEIIGEIGRGILIFLGVGHDDTREDVRWCVNKAVNLRIFPDEADKMNLSLKDIDGEMLVVSQFTLYGDAAQGRRPSFIASAKEPQASDLYNRFVEDVGKEVKKVATGQFAAKMDVSLINEGPVTLWVESP